jgi:hypothetical protein
VSLGVRLFGKWADAHRITTTMADRFAKAARQAMLREAQLLRANIVKNLQSGGQHAGKPFAPPSEMTLIVRQFRGFGGSKPLIVTGALLGSVAVSPLGANAVFVGIRRGTGKGKGGTNLASLHETGGGPWSRQMTDKQRRFLAAALRSAGKTFGDVAGGGGVLKIRIPARPYVGPVVDKFHRPKDVRTRFWAFISKAMGGDLGR